MFYFYLNNVDFLIKVGKKGRLRTYYFEDRWTGKEWFFWC